MIYVKWSNMAGIVWYEISGSYVLVPRSRTRRILETMALQDPCVSVVFWALSRGAALDASQQHCTDLHSAPAASPSSLALDPRRGVS